MYRKKKKKIWVLGHVGFAKNEKADASAKEAAINPWSPSGSFMVQKMAITSPIPIF